MGALKDVAQWTVVELRVCWCTVSLLLQLFVGWLLCHIPSFKARIYAPHERVMHPFAGNWQVRAKEAFISLIQSHLVSSDLVSTDLVHLN